MCCSLVLVQKDKKQHQEHHTKGTGGRGPLAFTSSANFLASELEEEDSFGAMIIVGGKMVRMVSSRSFIVCNEFRYCFRGATLLAQDYLQCRKMIEIFIDGCLNFRDICNIY